MELCGVHMHERSEMTLNYQVVVKRYPFSNGVVGGSISAVKSSLYLTEGKKLVRWVGSQEPTQCNVGMKPHPAPRGFSSRVGPTGSNSSWIA